MVDPANELFQLEETSGISSDIAFGISSYVSCIRVNGRPILPPLITQERRQELKKFKKKAIEIEHKLKENKHKSVIYVKTTSTSNDKKPLKTESPRKQSAPTRPVTLHLMSNVPDRTFISSSSTDSNVKRTLSVQEISKVKKDSNVNSDTNSSQKSTNKSKSMHFKSTLEQRLASENNNSVQNKKNVYEPSPILEENFPLTIGEYVDSDDSKQEKKSWSPLKIDSINSLRIELSNKDSYVDDKCVSLDDLENSSETLTESPGLMRQNSYTLLTPSPALLRYLEVQKGEETKRSHSGRKTWDLSKARKNWNPNVAEDVEKLKKEQVNDDNNSEKLLVGKTDKNSDSLDGFSVFQTCIIRNSSPNAEHQNLNSYTDEGSTSPSSYSFRTTSPKFQKIKCKVKNRRVKPHKIVPSPLKPTDKVPNFGSNTMQEPETVFVPLHIKEELRDLSNLLLKMKMEHERQKKELEEKQKTEMNELEVLLRKRQSELLCGISQESAVYPRSIYSQYSDQQESGEFHTQMIGDGRHNSVEKCSYNREHVRSYTLEENLNRPQSAKDYYVQSFVHNGDRRTRSMDFTQSVPSQDTDFDFSFQDSLPSKEIYIRNEDLIETDTLSNFSSHSSTMSSDTKLESMPLLDVRKFRPDNMTPEKFERYNQAAAVITAAAKGFLTRRLLRTAHVQGLITTLRDAISCATQLHGASDLGESDVDLMKRLGRQIEAAWDAVYAVFFDTDSTVKMQLISADRERLRSISSKLQGSEPKKRISSATLKSLRRKSGTEFVMSKSQVSNGSGKARRIRPRMMASYPGPSVRYKLK